MNSLLGDGCLLSIKEINTHFVLLVLFVVQNLNLVLACL